MTPSRVPFKLPPVIGATVQPDPLESLYSPQLNKLSITTDRLLERDSVAVSDFNDIALDDDSFSPVALSARPLDVPTPPPPSRPQKGGVDEGKEEDIQNGGVSEDTANTLLPLPRAVPIQFPVISSLKETAKSHKRTASTITIRSTHSRNNSLLANRVDLSPNPNRGSVDGHLKLQEEFHRLQENQMTTSESSIDWGVYCAS